MGVSTCMWQRNRERGRERERGKDGGKGDLLQSVYTQWDCWRGFWWPTLYFRLEGREQQKVGSSILVYIMHIMYILTIWLTISPQQIYIKTIYPELCSTTTHSLLLCLLCITIFQSLHWFHNTSVQSPSFHLWRWSSLCLLDPTRKPGVIRAFPISEPQGTHD